MTRGNRAKSIANNQRTLRKNHRKMKETGKSLGKIDCKCKKTLKIHEEAVETAGKHDNDQRKSYKIPWKTEETRANARNKP